MSASFMPEFSSAGRVVVSAKADDPLARPARARLIWAANTAHACQSLGLPTTLVGTAQELPYPVETVAGLSAVRRTLEELYGIQCEFDIRLVLKEKNDESRVYIKDYPVNILPHAGLVHTRDPRIAEICSRRRIPFIIEFHDEAYQAPQFWGKTDYASPDCRAVVAITDSVAETLLSAGIPSDKIIVEQSGANADAAKDLSEKASVWRQYFLEDRYSKLVVYSGGLQLERGVDQIIKAASMIRDAIFVLCGGTESDRLEFRRRMKRENVENVRLPGYLPFAPLCEIQQAADTLLFTRSAHKRSAITSPLKVFEYMLSGRPIVAAGIPALSSLEGRVTLTTYQAGSVTSLVEALTRSLEKSVWSRDRLADNIEVGLEHTWRARQTRILSFAGGIDRRSTF